MAEDESVFDRLLTNKENPEGVNEMCKVIEEMRKEEREEGIKKGMRNVALRMLAAGKYAVNASLKMSVFAEKECPFSPDSIQVYTALTTTLLVGLKPVKP